MYIANFFIIFQNKFKLNFTMIIIMLTVILTIWKVFSRGLFVLVNGMTIHKTSMMKCSKHHIKNCTDLMQSWSCLFQVTCFYLSKPYMAYIPWQIFQVLKPHLNPCQRISIISGIADSLQWMNVFNLCILWRNIFDLYLLRKTFFTILLMIWTFERVYYMA